MIYDTMYIDMSRGTIKVINGYKKHFPIVLLKLKNIKDVKKSALHNFNVTLIDINYQSYLRSPGIHRTLRPSCIISVYMRTLLWAPHSVLCMLRIRMWVDTVR